MRVCARACLFLNRGVPDKDGPQQRTCGMLQIPPEAWLRLSTFNCSITYLVRIIRPCLSVPPAPPRGLKPNPLHPSLMTRGDVPRCPFPCSLAFAMPKDSLAVDRRSPLSCYDMLPSGTARRLHAPRAVSPSGDPSEWNRVAPHARRRGPSAHGQDNLLHASRLRMVTGCCVLDDELEFR